MKKRILAYVKRINGCINGEIPVDSWEELLEEHILQLGWFQHERFVHMFIMLAFAIFTVACIMTEVVTGYTPLLAVIALFLILLIPYIKHYYLMENKCQEMLDQYDAIWAKVKEERRSKENKKEN